MRCWCLVLTTIVGMASAAAAAEPLMTFDLPGRTVVGTPLARSDEAIFLLGRDGQLLELPLAQAKDPVQLPGSFTSLTQAEVRGLLLREFGPGYEVSGVGHYLVVHPAGERDQWAPRFEELYRSFRQYFAARGWSLAEPRFPLVAVVYRRQADFTRQAARDGLTQVAGVLGYYSPMTNRILMFDPGRSGPEWSSSAETIIHEAAHQTAYNTGVHTRFAATPRWLVEGLGTLFEARGVWQSRTYPTPSARLNRDQLQSFRDHSGRRPADAIARIISSDRVFTANPDGAYAEAWTLTFFLSESEPKKYQQLLAKTAARAAFSAYPAPQRLKDFTDIFGSDLKMLDARLQRFVAGLK